MKKYIIYHKCTLFVQILLFSSIFNPLFALSEGSFEFFRAESARIQEPRRIIIEDDAPTNWAVPIENQLQNAILTGNIQAIIPLLNNLQTDINAIYGYSVTLFQLFLLETVSSTYEEHLDQYMAITEAFLNFENLDVTVLIPFTQENILHLSVHYDFPEMMTLLLNALRESRVNDPINALNFQNDTPLHLAARFGAEHAVRFLLENNARTDLVNIQNQTAYDSAILGGYPNIANLINQYHQDQHLD